MLDEALLGLIDRSRATGGGGRGTDIIRDAASILRDNSGQHILGKAAVASTWHVPPGTGRRSRWSLDDNLLGIAAYTPGLNDFAEDGIAGNLNPSDLWRFHASADGC